MLVLLTSGARLHIYNTGEIINLSVKNFVQSLLKFSVVFFCLNLLSGDMGGGEFIILVIAEI